MTPSSASARALPLHRPPSPSCGTTSSAWNGPATRPQVPIAWAQGTLALDLDGEAEVAGVPGAPELSVVLRREDGPQRELEVWAARFAQAALEVLAGDRPVTQLLRWTSSQVYLDLERRARILARTAPAPRRRRSVRPQVHSVHVFRPGPAVAEVSVHVRHGERSRALAARLEQRADHWLCVALQLG
jgi:hypothetical protein